MILERKVSSSKEYPLSSVRGWLKMSPLSAQITNTPTVPLQRSETPSLISAKHGSAYPSYSLKKSLPESMEELQTELISARRALLVARQEKRAIEKEASRARSAIAELQQSIGRTQATAEDLESRLLVLQTERGQLDRVARALHTKVSKLETESSRSEKASADRIHRLKEELQAAAQSREALLRELIAMRGREAEREGLLKHSGHMLVKAQRLGEEAVRDVGQIRTQLQEERDRRKKVEIQCMDLQRSLHRREMTPTNL